MDPIAAFAWIYIATFVSTASVTFLGIIENIPVRIKEKHQDILMTILRVQLLGGIGGAALLSILSAAGVNVATTRAQADSTEQQDTSISPHESKELEKETPDTIDGASPKPSNHSEHNTASDVTSAHVDNCASNTNMDVNGCTAALKRLTTTDAFVDLNPSIIEWKNIKEYSTPCVVNKGVEAQFPHPSLSTPMEVEFQLNGTLIEIEYENLPVDSLPSNIREALASKIPQFSSTHYEKEVHLDGSTFYEFEIDSDQDIDKTLDQNGALVVTNTCDSGTPSNPEAT